MPSLTPCTTCSQSLEPGAYEMTTKITKDSSADAFFHNWPKDYKIESGGRCGWNALCVAADRGNVGLVKSILKYCDAKSLVNLGNDWGWTPLFCAARCKDHGAAVEVAKVLLEHGADVNMTTNNRCMGAMGLTEEGTSPLYVAAEKTHNVALAKLLVEKGAAAGPELSVEGQTLIRQAFGTPNTDYKLFSTPPFLKGNSEKYQYCTFGKGGKDPGEADLERNARPREAIVAALGGVEGCKKIPTVNLVHPLVNQAPGVESVPDYLECPSMEDFKKGESGIIQGIDATGRAYVAVRVEDKETGKIQYGILNQRMREVGIFGDRWNGEEVLEKNPARSDMSDVLQTLSQLVQGTHQKWALAAP